MKSLSLAAARCLHRLLLYPLVASLALGSAALADTSVATPAAATYTVIQLSANPSGAVINNKGQVAFNEEDASSVFRAFFYDGKSTHQVGGLGGLNVVASALNDLGQVTGTADVAADGSLHHAYRWSAATGTLDLAKPGTGNSNGYAINNKGEVAGYAEFVSGDPLSGQALFWSHRTGMVPVGTLGQPGTGSVATLINDAGVVSGISESDTGGPFSPVVFRWTLAGGIHGIGTEAGEFTYPTGINAAGHIVGGTPFGTDIQPHAFLWTRQQGLLDLGTGSLDSSVAFAVNNRDVVVGQVQRKFIGPFYGFIWTRAGGLIELRGANPDAASFASDVNNRGQVVGTLDGHAFVWNTAGEGTDLNTRIPGAPAGLTLLSADGIADNGSIIATANTGLVLLVPQCGCTNRAPTVASIAVSGKERVGFALSFAAAFKDVDMRDTHSARWSWGDGSQDAGIVSEKAGSGSVSGQHVYRTAGVHTVALTVTDSSGKRSTVQRKLVICGSAHAIVGEGWFSSLPGASKLAPKQGGVGRFAVLAGGPGAAIDFNAPGINLHSQQITSLALQGKRIQLTATATVNGKAGYRIQVSSLPGAVAGSHDRVRVRVWHRGATGEVVDYDNQSGGNNGAADAGMAVGEGGIAVQPD